MEKYSYHLSAQSKRTALAVAQRLRRPPAGARSGSRPKWSATTSTARTSSACSAFLGKAARVADRERVRFFHEPVDLQLVGRRIDGRHRVVPHQPEAELVGLVAGQQEFAFRRCRRSQPGGAETAAAARNRRRFMGSLILYHPASRGSRQAGVQLPLGARPIGLAQAVVQSRQVVMRYRIAGVQFRTAAAFRVAASSNLRCSSSSTPSSKCDSQKSPFCAIELRSSASACRNRPSRQRLAVEVAAQIVVRGAAWQMPRRLSVMRGN